MNIKKIFGIIFLIASFQNISAQTSPQDGELLSLESGTIDNQFEFVIQKSNRYLEYKVVKKEWLKTLKAHTLDSLSSIKKDLLDTENRVDVLSQEIMDLKINLENSQIALSEANNKNDTIGFFGMQMSKLGYTSLVWGIIFVLSILLSFFVFKYKNSHKVTKSVQLKLQELETEYEDHRRTALEREQKIRRKLQDEINKHKTKTNK